MTTKEEIHETWAPSGGVWSNWVKPVLFACMEQPPTELPPVEISGPPGLLPPLNEGVALVLDLPGDEAVKLGLTLARAGYRPVPLYNAVPMPVMTSEEVKRGYEEGYSTLPVVNVMPIMAALWRGADLLSQCSIPPGAPPVFLLDANRRAGTTKPQPGRFDNRSVSFTTDFPSATFLRANQIHKAVLVQASGLEPQSDLAHTLRGWQEGGLAIEVKNLDVPGAAVPIVVRRPSSFGRFWHRLFVTFRLRRNPLGGFGGMIPEPGAEGGGAAG